MKFEKILQNRKTLVITLVGTVAFVLTSFNLLSWLFLKRIGKSLDEELGRRLQAVAGLVAKLVESEVFSGRLTREINDVDRYFLRVTFDELRKENQLQAIYLIDQNLVTLVASPEHFTPGEIIGYLKEDSLQIQLALRGQVIPSPLHLVQGNRFKSAYAPFQNELGDNLGLVVVEASANFFSLLRFFQKGLILGGITSGIVILLFTLFILWAVTFFIRMQETLHRNERLAAMGQMAATVAHEIRNPLGIIKSTAEVLRNRYQRDSKTGELFDFIPSEVERLNRLVNDFLTFARDRHVDRVEADLVKTIERALEDLKSECQDQALEIIFKPGLPELKIKHNPDGIRQVVLNLVQNAIDALNGRGHIEVFLNLETNWGRKMVKVSVMDNGPGLGEVAEKIFEPFFTTKTSGSGLGLAVTKQIIEKHGGQIEAESLEQGGTIFRFYLPL